MSDTVFVLKIREMLAPRLQRLGLSDSDLLNSENLIQAGILDSLTLIEFVSEVEEEFDLVFDFEQIDITEFTSVEKISAILGDLKKN